MEFDLYCFVRHAFNEINEVRHQISRSWVVRRTKLGTLVVLALLYISAEIHELRPRESSLGRHDTEGCKKIVMLFLEHCLAERDEMWHNKGHWCVADLKIFL